MVDMAGNKKKKPVLKMHKPAKLPMFVFKPGIW